jgi:acetoin utilization deacetylase AcuC-like enzyme
MGRKVGYVFDERYLWHRPWSVQYSSLVEPYHHWESPETKRRLHSLLAVSGLLGQLQLVKPQVATDAQLERVHSRRYLDELQQRSEKEEGGNAGEEAPFSQFAMDIARLSVGGVLAAADAVMDGKVDVAYALTRPPGHHAVKDRGMGFCLLNNVAITAKHLLETYPTTIHKVAIVDYDVHHGNGTQEAFYDDERVLFVSLHQANNYPADSGAASERGKGKGEGFNVNLPLPPGSGAGAYEYAFKSVVLPALERFEPDFVLVSSGFDASYADPLAAMILSSSVFRFMARELIDAATRLCGGKIVFAHEGGYSETYVPFCGAAVVEELLGVQCTEKQIKDPFLSEVERWGYQELQGHQKKVVDSVAVMENLSTN